MARNTHQRCEKYLSWVTESGMVVLADLTAYLKPVVAVKEQGWIDA